MQRSRLIQVKWQHFNVLEHQKLHWYVLNKPLFLHQMLVNISSDHPANDREACIYRRHLDWQSMLVSSMAHSCWSLFAWSSPGSLLVSSSMGVSTALENPLVSYRAANPSNPKVAQKSTPTYHFPSRLEIEKHPECTRKMPQKCDFCTFGVFRRVSAEAFRGLSCSVCWGYFACGELSYFVAGRGFSTRLLPFIAMTDLCQFSFKALACNIQAARWALEK